MIIDADVQRVTVGDVDLAYITAGDPADPPVLLVAGLGAQLISWEDGFCQALVDRGLYVIRFDNRDAGLSTHLGESGEIAYPLTELAADAAGLIDVLGLGSAHVVGVSMGGMIAQTVAAHHPGRVRTLTSIMSNTGAKRIGRPAPSTWWRMATGKPPRNRTEAADAAAKTFRHIGSHGFAFDEAWVRDTAGIAWDRDPRPAGVARQLAAIFASGDRTAELRQIDVPTLVIHGDRDRMVHPSGGAATARAIPAARLETIVGMGHDLPSGAWGTLHDLIADHLRRSTVRSKEVK
jgi:pimeloyl-ACP methyl ester carboxylesterase